MKNTSSNEKGQVSSLRIDRSVTDETSSIIEEEYQVVSVMSDLLRTLEKNCNSR